MRVLLVSTYELGHQPLAVATPAAALIERGHEVRAVDLAVDTLDPSDVEWAERVAISVPMHTAMRIGVEVAGRIRSEHPDKPLAMYGLYAAVSADRTVGSLVDVALVGEYLPTLVEWAGGGLPGGVSIDLGIGPTPVPARHLLPGLERYAHLQEGDRHRMVGYVEASRGCRHRCRHCPIPAIYDGIYRIVGADPLLADIEQLVGMGATHITFGDPDFLNGPAHSMRVIEEVHRLHPELTFDVTIKVEHLLAHSDLLPRLAAAGTLFVVSAFETTDDRSLELLDKGHTVADMERALTLARAAGLDIRPSWMPFMPWTTPEDVVDIFRFLDRHELLTSTDPIQMSIRLLVPEGSLMLGVMDVGEYDPRGLGYHWESLDPRAGELQRRLAAIAGAAAETGREPAETMVEMWGVALAAAGQDSEEAQIPAGATAGRPRMTEPWFC